MEIYYQISYPSNKAKIKPLDGPTCDFKNGGILTVHFPPPEHSIIVENVIYDSLF